MARSLFKYLPSQFVDALVRRGQVLARNLAYFRALEEVQRGDMEVATLHGRTSS